LAFSFGFLSGVELGGDEDDVLAIYAVLVGPIFGLEVALHGEHRALLFKNLAHCSNLALENQQVTNSSFPNPLFKIFL